MSSRPSSPTGVPACSAPPSLFRAAASLVWAARLKKSWPAQSGRFDSFWSVRQAGSISTHDNPARQRLRLPSGDVNCMNWVGPHALRCLGQEERIIPRVRFGKNGQAQVHGTNRQHFFPGSHRIVFAMGHPGRRARGTPSEHSATAQQAGPTGGASQGKGRKRSGHRSRCLVS